MDDHSRAEIAGREPVDNRFRHRSTSPQTAGDAASVIHLMKTAKIPGVIASSAFHRSPSPTFGTGRGGGEAIDRMPAWVRRDKT